MDRNKENYENVYSNLAEKAGKVHGSENNESHPISFLFELKYSIPNFISSLFLSHIFITLFVFFLFLLAMFDVYLTREESRTFRNKR